MALPDAIDAGDVGALLIHLFHQLGSREGHEGVTQRPCITMETLTESVVVHTDGSNIV